MWEVNPKATKQLLEALWSAHVLDWSNLEIDRMSKINRTLDRPWVYEYQGGEVFFESWGGSFFAAGSSLFYAGAMLSKLSGEKEPLLWSKRLARRYIETRNPQTGIAGEVYTVSKVEG